MKRLIRVSVLFFLILLIATPQSSAEDFSVIIKGPGRNGPNMDLFKIGLKILSEENHTVMVEYYTILDYNNPEIPEQVEYKGIFYKIVALGHKLFSNPLTTVTIRIPASIINIASDTFIKCYRVSAFHVDEDNPVYTSVDGVLLTKDRKKVIAIPRNFFGTMVIPEGVESIGDYAAYGMIGPNGPANAECISLPLSLREIGKNVFAFNQIKSFNLTQNNFYFKVIDGVLFTTDDVLVSYPGKKEGNYSFPLSTLHIANCAFTGSKLSMVVFNEGLLTIGDSIFFESCPEKVVIPGTVTTIGQHAFHDFYKNSIEIQMRPITSLPIVAQETFSFYSLLTLSVPESQLSLYKSNEPWSKFYKICTYKPGGEGDFVDIKTVNFDDNSVLFDILGKGILSITVSENCIIPIYSVDGSIKRKVQLFKGVNYIQELPIGCYIISGQKILIK